MAEACTAKPLEDAARKNAVVLNGMSADERLAFYEFVLHEWGNAVPTPTTVIPGLEDFKPLHAGLPTGAEILAFITCYLLPPPGKRLFNEREESKATGADKYPRFPINFREKTRANGWMNALGKFAFGAFTPQDANSVPARVKRLFSAQTWAAWKEVSNQAGRKPTLKIGVHHIALAARYPNDPSAIPLNCGRGGSASHQCDKERCMNKKHLLSAVKHKDNMIRQNCVGATLITQDGVILAFLPCPHAEPNALGEPDVWTSCARVNHIDLGKLFGGMNFRNPVLAECMELALAG